MNFSGNSHSDASLTNYSWPSSRLGCSLLGDTMIRSRPVNNILLRYNGREPSYRARDGTWLTEGNNAGIINGIDASDKRNRVPMNIVPLIVALEESLNRIAWMQRVCNLKLFFYVCSITRMQDNWRSERCSKVLFVPISDPLFFHHFDDMVSS